MRPLPHSGPMFSYQAALLAAFTFQCSIEATLCLGLMACEQGSKVDLAAFAQRVPSDGSAADARADGASGGDRWFECVYVTCKGEQCRCSKDSDCVHTEYDRPARRGHCYCISDARHGSVINVRFKERFEKQYRKADCPESDKSGDHCPQGIITRAGSGAGRVRCLDHKCSEILRSYNFDCSKLFLGGE